jgi:hypothetical protein
VVTPELTSQDHGSQAIEEPLETTDVVFEHAAVLAPRPLPLVAVLPPVPEVASVTTVLPQPTNRAAAPRKKSFAEFMVRPFEKFVGQAFSTCRAESRAIEIPGKSSSRGC